MTQRKPDTIAPKPIAIELDELPLILELNPIPTEVGDAVTIFTPIPMDPVPPAEN